MTSDEVGGSSQVDPKFNNLGSNVEGLVELLDVVDGTLLKKNGTSIQTFEGVVNELLDEYGLVKKSEGTERKTIETDKQQKTQPAIGATGLAAKMAQVTA